MNSTLTTAYSYQPAPQTQCRSVPLPASKATSPLVHFGQGADDAFVKEGEGTTSLKKPSRSVTSKVIIGLGLVTAAIGGVVALTNPLSWTLGAIIGGAGLLTSFLSWFIGKPKKGQPPEENPTPDEVSKIDISKSGSHNPQVALETNEKNKEVTEPVSDKVQQAEGAGEDEPVGDVGKGSSKAEIKVEPESDQSTKPKPALKNWLKTLRYPALITFFGLLSWLGFKAIKPLSSEKTEQIQPIVRPKVSPNLNQQDGVGFNMAFAMDWDAPEAKTYRNEYHEYGKRLKQYSSIYDLERKNNKLPPILLPFFEGLTFQESKGDKDVDNPNPTSTAKGLWQSIDDNAEALGIKNRYAPQESSEKMIKSHAGVLRDYGALEAMAASHNTGYPGFDRRIVQAAFASFTGEKKETLEKQITAAMLQMFFKGTLNSNVLKTIVKSKLLKEIDKAKIEQWKTWKKTKPTEKDIQDAAQFIIDNAGSRVIRTFVRKVFNLVASDDNPRYNELAVIRSKIVQNFDYKTDMGPLYQKIIEGNDKLKEHVTLVMTYFNWFYQNKPYKT